MKYNVINLINVIVLLYFLIVITFSERKKETTKETTHDQIEKICWDMVTLFVFCLFVYINAKDDDSKFFYISVYILFLFVGVFAMNEVLNENEYMVNYLLFTLLYIEMITTASFLIQQLGKIYYTKKGQVNPEFLLILSIWVMISMIAIWCLYFLIPKRMHEKYKNIDLINLKTLFLKSTFQSITTFIALYGLARAGLPNFYKTFALFINATAAFSYPILDINKYLREKEIEYSKNYAPIRSDIKTKK